MFWLSLLALPLRTDLDQVVQRVVPIQVSAKDTTDLEPFRKAIGNARIVQLGELTHGDGTSFELKTRLVKYLHERAGFDVLVWESGFVECLDLDAGLRGKEPLLDVARRAVFSHWSRGRESFGVFEYARASHSTRRPLLMAGFDIQSSGSEGNMTFLRLADAVLTSADKDLRDRLAEIRKMPAADAREAAALNLAEEIQQTLEKNRPALSKTLKPAELATLTQKVKSMVAYDAMMKAFLKYQQVQTGVEFQVGYNLRERANFENLAWLLENSFKGKKVIVWAHNAHVSNFGSDGIYRVAGPNDVVLDSTGRWLKERYGARLYSVGFVASGGQWSWMGQPPQSFAPAGPDSIESLIGRAAAEHAFLDLKGLKILLDEPMDGDLNRQDPQVNRIVWPRAFDGLIYIRIGRAHV